MKLRYFGHSCFSVNLDGKHLLFDPFITPNSRAKHIDISIIPADFILVSHGHEDHVADVVAIAQRTGATVIANYEVALWFNKRGVEKIHPMNHGGWAMFDFGPVKFTPAIHSSSMPDGSYGGNPGGFLVESREGNFYYSGDTALTMDLKLIGECSKLKFAALCIGDNFTMGTDDAVKAADYLRCKEILGVHYDTFPPIVIDHSVAKEKFKAAGKNLHLLPVGETHDF
ncbi:MAG TPA: metal-dependent hydrolase [Verrucomicrobiae bacterium]|nr:metal-dependent hydrolase [Verrucomicrobiae bacterium]